MEKSDLKRCLGEQVKRYEPDLRQMAEDDRQQVDSEKALQAMQARWSGMVEQSKQHVERTRTESQKLRAETERLRQLEACVRQHIQDFDALDYRRKRAVNVAWLMDELRNALPRR